ncbi:MAG: hypothetical protein QF898_18160 [SAR202 cluster bacterium]|jgi:hypothetical protein|nr:hypothetical protein [SAR202 cluster bacterium]MDP6513154.1 hypothetical protein [SAR202 cluster bacterium]MDP6715273.1 hypothetical protein [SAR202 cluster bacterium]
MTTTAIRNTAVIPANENRGESKVRSIYNTIVHAVESIFVPGDLETLAAANRTKLDPREVANANALLTGVVPF